MTMSAELTSIFAAFCLYMSKEIKEWVEKPYRNIRNRSNYRLLHLKVLRHGDSKKSRMLIIILNYEKRENGYVIHSHELVIRFLELDNPFSRNSIRSLD